MLHRPILVKPISGGLGAEIEGVDLSALDDTAFAEINQAFLDHQVIFFRDQDITPEQQLNLALRFGDIHYHPYMSGMDDHPEILEIIKEPGRHIRLVPPGIRIRCSIRRPLKRPCCTPRKRQRLAGIRCFPACTKRMTVCLTR